MTALKLVLRSDRNWYISWGKERSDSKWGVRKTAGRPITLNMLCFLTSGSMQAQQDK